MKNKKFFVVAHGGAGSSNEHNDGTEEAVHTCYKARQMDINLTHSVALAVSVLEDDGRFNAGRGAHARKNGKSEHDAAIMDSNGSFGAVAVLEGFKNPIQAAEAVRLGAEGIGLCRTEHMFLGDRVPLVQKLILADNETDRNAALDMLLPLQREDFEGIFRVMGNRPTTIRLIDPPLHEFLPNETELLVEVTRLECTEPRSPKLSELRQMLAAIRTMHEENPMLGLRGCRLSFILPGIVQMQVTAIISAACQVKKEGIDVIPEIMIPLISHVNELKWVKDRLEPTAQRIMQEEELAIDYSFGTMIETPRAALTAGEIATEASFFSFGTNDLTQMTFGISRDDAGSFLPQYLNEAILPDDPTESIDQAGVGRLIKLCVDDAREVKPDLKLGICGEHGGDPRSIAFCHAVGMEYVSCSPKRLPIARYAAAQAALMDKDD